MKRLLVTASLLILTKIPAQTWKTEDQYIQKFAPYAVEEMEKYKIPASITLAQGLLETGGGQSRLAQEGKNHFGIKCKDDWTGKTMSHSDDARDECFRVYEDAKDSYEDHSKFLATRKFYAGLFNLDAKDYKAWAYGLKKAGYATNPRYPQMIIDKIERYHLDDFDTVSSKGVYATLLRHYPNMEHDAVFMAQASQQNIPKAPVTVKVPYEPKSYAQQQKEVQKLKTSAELLSTILVKNHPNGGLKFIIVPADTDVTFVAKKFGVREGKLMKWNELDSPVLRKNEVLFLESKNASGNVETYRAKVGETMHDIAQKFAIKLSKLYSKNRMDSGSQPQIGQLIYLQNKKPRD